jgi:hypothetical protein
MTAGVIDVGSHRQLFLDNRFIAASENVTLRMNSPHRLGPVLLPEKPWESHEIGFCTSVMEHEGEYWMFYRATSTDAGAGVCLAISRDGLHWERPSLGVVEFKGSRDNNIVFWDVGEAVVFFDPRGSQDARFKAVVVLNWPDPERGGIYVFTSPDGLHWTRPERRVLPLVPDTANQAHWDWRLGKYVAYIRVWRPLRKVGRIEMDDILAPWPYDRSVEPYYIWGRDKVPVTSREVPVAFGFDESDPPDTDVYNPAAVQYPWAADAYFMFPSAYHHFPEPPVGAVPNDGLLDIQMAVSRDGVTFHRVSRDPYISLNIDGRKDSKQLYMAVGMLRRGDEILQYYAGYETTHGGRRQKGAEHEPVGSICAAVQRLDGFVSADFAYGGGRLLTPPLLFEGSRLELNIDCSAMGRARVELRDASGQPIPGFTLDDADVLYGNQPHATVTWRGKADLAALAGKPVRLYVVARSAKLYAFQFLAT